METGTCVRCGEHGVHVCEMVGSCGCKVRERCGQWGKGLYHNGASCVNCGLVVRCTLGGAWSGRWVIN